MRRSRSTVFVILVLAFLSASAIGRKLDRRLQIIDLKGDGWCIAERGDEKGNGPVYRIYGDTLLCEVFDDVRLWYGIKRDTVMYLGEESRHYDFRLSVPVPTSSFSLNPGLSGEDSSYSTGFVYTTLPAEREYVHTGGEPVRGHLVLEDGRKVAATAVTEKFSYVQSYLIDPEKPVRTREVHRSVTRWFLPGDCLPAVYQITEVTDMGDGSEPEEFTEAYSVDFETAPLDEDRDLDNEWIIDAVNVYVSGGRLVVTGDFPDNVNLEVSISTVSGTVCHTYPSVSNVSNRDIEFLLPSLPAGNYIVTVSAGSPVSKKQFVTI